MSEIPIRCVTASVLILRDGSAGVEVLMLRRVGHLDGQWCQVAGKIELGETAWQAALRETREETGLTPDRLYSADVCEQFYEGDRDSIALVPVFVGFVSPHAQVTLNREHSEFRWMSFAEAREMVPFAGQRHVLDVVEREFVDRAPNDLLIVYPRATR